MAAADSQLEKGQPTASTPSYEKELEQDRDSALWLAPTTILTKAHMLSDVDPEKSMFPLAAYCFMTGFMCVPSPLLV